MPPTLTPLSDADPQAVEDLLDSAFGFDRRQRTAYRLREGVSALGACSFAAWDDGRLVGSLQSWPVALRTVETTEPMTMVGPVAVLPAWQGRGVGTALMNALVAVTDAPMIMIGDASYYSRWGFTADHTGGWRIDGPFDPARLLARSSARLPEDGELMSIHHPELVTHWRGT